MKLMRCEVCEAQMVVPTTRRPWPCMRCTVTSVEFVLFVAGTKDLTLSDETAKYWNEAPPLDPIARRLH